MKRQTLIRRIRALGARFVREGQSHTIYCNPRSGTLLPIPRHREINDALARKIIRDASE